VQGSGDAVLPAQHAHVQQLASDVHGGRDVLAALFCDAPGTDAGVHLGGLCAAGAVQRDGAWDGSGAAGRGVDGAVCGHYGDGADWASDGGVCAGPCGTRSGEQCGCCGCVA